MNAGSIAPALGLIFLTACAGVPTTPAPQGRDSTPASANTRVSGILGITEVTAMDLELDASIGTSDEDDLTLPMIGAQFQFPSSQNRLEWGFETGFSLGWESDRDAVVIDTGVILVEADNELAIFDVSGGLYVGAMLGERVRVYGGAGPLIQFARVDLDFDTSIDGKGGLKEDGIGFGYYTRAGIEYQFRPGTMIGLVARWVDSSVDLGSKLEELEMEAIQVGLSVTTGF